MRRAIRTRFLTGLAAFATVLELSACSSRASYVRGPDGQDWISVRCSRRKEVNCLKRAGKLCPDGYAVSNAAHAAGHMLIKCWGDSPRVRAAERKHRNEPIEPAPDREPLRSAYPQPAAEPAPAARRPVVPPPAPVPQPDSAVEPGPTVVMTSEEQEALKRREAEFEEWKKAQPAGQPAQ